MIRFLHELENPCSSHENGQSKVNRTIAQFFEKMAFHLYTRLSCRLRIIHERKHFISRKLLVHKSWPV